MPLYDFSCECGFSFEAIVPTSDVETIPCKKCGQTATKSQDVPLVGWRNPSYGIIR